MSWEYFWASRCPLKSMRPILSMAVVSDPSAGSAETGQTNKQHPDKQGLVMTTPVLSQCARFGGGGPGRDIVLETSDIVHRDEQSSSPTNQIRANRHSHRRRRISFVRPPVPRPEPEPYHRHPDNTKTPPPAPSTHRTLSPSFSSVPQVLQSTLTSAALQNGAHSGQVGYLPPGTHSGDDRLVLGL